jgi:hypothetical protein
MALPAALMIGGALLGAAAGAQGSKGKSETSSMNLAPESELERLARLQQEQGFGDLNRIQHEDFGRANQASQSYGNMLQDYQKSGGIPTSADLSQGRSFAEQMTAPQQAQIDLSMRQSTEAMREQSGLSGRGPNDFAFNTRLAGQRSDLMSQLGAQQSAMGSQYAQQISQNRLGYAGQFADLQQGLASQAMQNRMAIMGLGSQIQNAGRNFRTNTATRNTSTPDTPGTMLSTLTGAFAGAQGGMSMANAFNKMSPAQGSNNSDFSASNMNFGPGLQMPSMQTQSQPNYLGYTPGMSSGAASRSPASTGFSMPTSNFSAPSTQPQMGAWPGMQGSPWDYNAALRQGPAQIGIQLPLGR